jgi:signal-transduction protein with cAMP-binding, CBS, and nucleotidyltransferase domain
VCFVKEKFTQGFTIISPEEANTNLYFITSGKVGYVHYAEGKNLCLQILKKGDVFGYESLDKSLSKYPLIALGNVTTYKIATETLVDIS